MQSATSVEQNTTNGAALVELEHGVIRPDQHLDYLNDPTKTGKFHFFLPGETATPWVGLIKTGSETVSDAFATKTELFIWLLADGKPETVVTNGNGNGNGNGAAAEIKYTCKNPNCADHDAPVPEAFTKTVDGKIACMSCNTIYDGTPVSTTNGNGNGNGSEPKTAPVIDEIPIGTNGNGSKVTEPVPEPATQVEYTYEDPGENWLDELGESYKLARESADENAPEFVEFPTSLIRSAIKENNHITKRDVESVLAEFSMNVSLGQYQEDAMALVVTDINDKAGMKKARELRLVGKRERVRFDQQGADAKEPLLRRTQLIDGIRRSVRQKFEACEAHLLEQEQFEQRELDRIATELESTRIEDLKQFEWQPESLKPDDLKALKIGYMSETEWTAFRSNIETEYINKKELERIENEQRRAEEERLERENARLQKVDERVAELTKLGLNYDGAQFTYADIVIEKINIEHASDDAFARLMEKLTPQVEAAKNAEFAADQERLRLKNEAEAAKAKAKAAQDDLDRQAAEKKAEEERQAAEAEAKRLAPDKEKLEAWAVAFESIEEPMMAGDATRKIRDEFHFKVQGAIAEMRQQLEKV